MTTPTNEMYLLKKKMLLNQIRIINLPIIIQSASFEYKEIQKKQSGHIIKLSSDNMEIIKEKQIDFCIDNNIVNMLFMYKNIKRNIVNRKEKK